MKIKYLYIFLFILLTSLSSCGYKLVNQSGGESYFINKFEVSGEKRLGHSIKNEILLSSSKEEDNKINMRLDIKKNKEIKEKNIAGKISSYTITLNISLSLENIKDEKTINKNFTKSDSYDVASNHSDTLSNEKTALKNLTEKITEDIINFLTIKN